MLRKSLELLQGVGWHGKPEETAVIPKNIKDLAGLLAPLCRLLRDDVTDALQDPQSPLVQLAKDWRQLLFPDARDDQFAGS